MADDTTDGIVEFLLERAGERLRSVVRYGSEGSDVLYLRDDVAEGYSVERMEATVEALRREGDRAAREEELYVHGDLNCVVRSFDAGLELHFPHGDGTGTAVGLDPEVAPNLNAFVGDCIERFGT